MLRTLSPQEELILKRLVEVFSEEPEVHEIILYGSRVRGGSTEKSDIDVLVLYNGQIRNFEVLKTKALSDIEDFLYVSIVPFEVKEFYRGQDEYPEECKKTRGNLMEEKFLEDIK